MNTQLPRLENYYDQFNRMTIDFSTLKRYFDAKNQTLNLSIQNKNKV